MTNFHATIHCHSERDRREVQDYVLSARYQRILFSGGCDLQLSTASLRHATFDAVIAPGNSFGEMSGGFDEGLIQAFGYPLQHSVTDAINKEHAGELNVGAALVVETHVNNIEHCAYAPTMRVPCTLPLDSDVPYMATRAALLALRDVYDKFTFREDEPIRVLIPLMGVGTGGLSIPYVCNQIQLAVSSLLEQYRPVRNLEEGSDYDHVIRGGAVRKAY